MLFNRRASVGGIIEKKHVSLSDALFHRGSALRKAARHVREKNKLCDRVTNCVVNHDYQKELFIGFFSFFAAQVFIYIPARRSHKKYRSEP